MSGLFGWATFSGSFRVGDFLRKSRSVSQKLTIAALRVAANKNAELSKGIVRWLCSGRHSANGDGQFLRN